MDRAQIKLVLHGRHIAKPSTFSVEALIVFACFSVMITKDPVYTHHDRDGFSSTACFVGVEWRVVLHRFPGNEGRARGASLAGGDWRG